MLDGDTSESLTDSTGRRDGGNGYAMSDEHTHTTNGQTGPITPDQQRAELIKVFGLCRRRSRLAGHDMPHDWHPAGLPMQTAVSSVLTRICCYCAPDGVQIFVTWAGSDGEIATERQRHGPKLVIEQVKPGPKILRPGDPRFGG